MSVVMAQPAVITLTRRDGPMRLVLFPMIHLGTPALYQAATSRLGNSDSVPPCRVPAGSRADWQVSGRVAGHGASCDRTRSAAFLARRQTCGS